MAATSEHLQRTVGERRFTEALYHRLSVLILRLPPLRERDDDVVLLADHWLARAAADFGVAPKVLTPEARTALLAYPEAPPAPLRAAAPPQDAPRLKARLGDASGTF